jgi:hypothetical protein
MLYIKLRGCWCDIIVLNAHAPTKDKIDDMKDSFYDELERVFDKFPKYHMKILSEGFNAKYREKAFSNQQLRTGVYTELLMITELR